MSTTSGQSSRLSGLTRLGRVSIVWPLLVIALSILWALYVLGRLPGVLIDLIERGWPVVLVLAGLMLIMGRRIRFGNLVAILASVVLVAGIVTTAYSQQSGKERTENTIPFNNAVDPAVTSLKISINTLSTKLNIVADPKRALSGPFTGSRESSIAHDYKVDGNAGTFTLNETQSSALPPLESIGWGTLTLHVPAGVTFDEIAITGRDGDVQLDASNLTIKKLGVTTGSGNLTVTLPGKGALIDDLKTGRGDVTVTVPKSMVANIVLRGAGANNPEYNHGAYTLDINHVLISKQAGDVQIQLTIDTPGKITIQ